MRTKWSASNKAKLRVTYWNKTSVQNGQDLTRRGGGRGDTLLTYDIRVAIQVEEAAGDGRASRPPTLHILAVDAANRITITLVQCFLSGRHLPPGRGHGDTPFS